MLELGKESIDLFLALEGMEASFDIVAEDFGVRFADRPFTRDLRLHAVEGGIPTGWGQLRLRRTAGGTRTPMLRDQQIDFGACLGELDLQLL